MCCEVLGGKNEILIRYNFVIIEVHCDDFLAAFDTTSGTDTAQVIRIKVELTNTFVQLINAKHREKKCFKS